MKNKGAPCLLLLLLIPLCASLLIQPALAMNELTEATVHTYDVAEGKFLKPFVDIQVFILYKAVKQKQLWTILPGDRIEIDIGVKIPINTTHIPAKLSWRVEALNLESLRYENYTQKR